MDEAALVGELQGVQELAEITHRTDDGKGTVIRQHTAGVLAADEFHGDVEEVPAMTHVSKGDDTRVSELAQDIGFTQEAIDVPFGGGPDRLDRLEGDRGAIAMADRQGHDTHAAAAQP